MSEGEAPEFWGKPNNITVFPRIIAERETVERVAFNKDELQIILNLYGRMVAAGEWRDYAMDFLKDKAVFSIFRRSSEVPIYRVEKSPRLAAKQGTFSVVAATGLVLRRGPDLSRVLNVFDRKVRLVTG